MLKLAAYGGNSASLSKSVSTFNADMTAMHDALAPVCGKSLSVKFSGDLFYGVFETTISASGKDMTAHILPYLENAGKSDYDEDYWIKKFGKTTPLLNPRRKYSVRILDRFTYRFNQGLIDEAGYLK